MNNNNTFMQQLNAYKSFLKSFEQSMKSGVSVKNSIRESTQEYQRIIGENMKINMRNDYSSLGNNMKDYQKFIRKYKLESQEDIDDMILSMHELYDNEEQTERMINNFKNAMDQIEEKANNTSDNIKNSFGSAADWLQVLQLNKLINSVDSDTNTLLMSSNALQKSGIGSQEDVKSFREFITDTTKQLNEDTGNKYNLKDLYSDIATLAENTNISRVDTLKEITRPAMLAYKSMNVSLDSIADFSGKLYEYAGYDSLKLERMLDYTKGISKGINVNEQDIIDSQNLLSSSIEAYARYKGGDIDTEEVYNSISRVVSTLSNSGMDPNNFINLIKSYMDDPYDTGIVSQLTSLGIDTTTLGNDIITDLDKVADQYVYGMANLDNEYKESAGTFAKAYGGLDIDEIRKAGNAIASGSYANSKSLISNNASNIETGEAQTMEEAIEDQYISVSDSINNKMSTTLTLLTDIKEKLGFGFDDVIQAIATYSAIKGLFGGGTGNPLGKLFKGGGGTAGNMLSGAKALGSNALLNLGVLGETVLGASGAATTGMSLGKLALAGGTTIAGTAIGGMGVFSGLKDAYRAATGKGENGEELSGKQKQDKGFSAGSKLSMVGTGTAIGTMIGGPFGAAIGAGIGGLAALTTGTKVGKFLSDTWDSAREGASELWTSVEDWGSDTWDSIQDKASEAWSNMEELGKSAWKGIKSFGSKIWDSFTDKLINTKDLIEEKGLIKGLASSLLENTPGGRLLSKFGNYIQESFTDYAIPSYDVGTNYVPNDQLALVHEGEAIIPKEYNEDLNTLRRNQVNSNNFYNDSNSELLVESLNNLLLKVNALLVSFNEYSSNVEKHYNDNKLDKKISTNRNLMYARMSGASPSLRTTWV